MSDDMNMLPSRSFSSKKILVTGGSGHLGANLVRRLLRDGWEVRALVQPGANHRGLEGLSGIERFEADLRDREAMRRAVQGCGLVYHAAAKVSTRSPSPREEREIHEVNVLGTRHLVRASLESGVERFCLTGSFSGIGIDPIDPSRPVDESMPFYPFIEWLPYARSKNLAEHELLKGVAEGLDGVIAISTGIIGPNDFLPSRIGRTMIRFAQGRLRGYVPGGSEFVSTDDIVEGHLLAMHRGRKGERYLISTGFLAMDELLAAYARCTGRAMPRFRIPPAIMSIASQAYASTVRRAFPNAPQTLTPGTIRILTMNRHADISLAKRELGFRPGNIHDAIAQGFEFFRREGMLRD